MIRAGVAGLAKLALLLAGAAILAGVSLFVLGAWLSTYPLLRLSPQNRKMRAAMELAVAVAGVLSAMKDSPGSSPSPGDTDGGQGPPADDPRPVAPVETHA